MAAALAASGYAISVIERQARSQQQVARDFDRAAERAMAAVSDARTAWLASVAPGQGPDYWMPRALTSLDASRSDIVSLRQRTRTTTATSDLDAAVGGLDDLRDLHRQLAAQLDRDGRSAAARIVFADGLDGTGGLLQRIDSARYAEAGATEHDVAEARTRQGMAAAGGAGLALLVALLLLPSRQPDAAAAAPATAGELGDDTCSLRLRSDDGPAAPATAAASNATAAAEALAANGAQASDDSSARDRKKAPEVRAAADLCTDFARLVDAQELPGLLERSARLLDAPGFVVWLVDADGKHLRASLAHGYAPQALARMPVIDRFADNATAAAFRLHDVQIVTTNGMSNGAIAVPLLSPQGCIGVIAAEVRHGRESSEIMRQIARLVAAQLSTLVAPAHAAQQQEPLRDAGAM